MANVVIFGPTQSGKTTLLGYLATGMLREPQFNEDVFGKLKLIKSLSIDDEFNVGNPSSPDNVNKDVILPSFISLDRDELRKFRDSSTEGTTKRLHRKQLTICVSEPDELKALRNENENISCTFVDLPGFRQRLSDKYLSFLEGDIGVAMITLKEVIMLNSLLNKSHLTSEETKNLEKYRLRLFEPIRIWCDYRSSSKLIIVVSQIDRGYADSNEEKERQRNDIQNAIDCIRLNISDFSSDETIPISPISIRLKSEPNTKANPRMKVFFHRIEENIYQRNELPGDGAFISCLRKIMPIHKSNINRDFTMATVYRIMKAQVNHVSKTAFNILALHGTLHDTDTIFLGPVIEKKTDHIVYAKCTVSSVKADGIAKPTKALLEGNVGGVIFSSIQDFYQSYQYFVNFVPNHSEIKLLKSSILFSGSHIDGDLIELEICKSDFTSINGHIDEIYSELLHSLMPYDQIFLFWYRKKVSVNIVEIRFESERIQLTVITSYSERNTVRHFTLPCHEDSSLLHNDNVLLAIPGFKSRKESSQIYTYVSAYVKKLKNSNEYDLLEMEAVPDLNLEIVLRQSFNVKTNVQDEHHKCLISIKDNQKDISLYSVLTRVGRNIKKYVNRDVYRQLGGLRLRLIRKSDMIHF